MPSAIEIAREMARLIDTDKSAEAVAVELFCTFPTATYGDIELAQSIAEDQIAMWTEEHRAGMAPAG